jgi:twitching motility protein PilT
MIRDAKTHQLPTAMQTGHQYGMRTMDESLADLYRSGRISLDTALSRAVDQQVLRTLLEKQQ